MGVLGRGGEGGSCIWACGRRLVTIIIVVFVLCFCVLLLLGFREDFAFRLKGFNIQLSGHCGAPSFVPRYVFGERSLGMCVRTGVSWFGPLGAQLPAAGS